MRASIRPIVIGGALLAVLVRGVFPTLAQTLDTSETTVAQALEVQTVLGFSNTFRLGAWTPLTVIVTNHDQNLSAELQVQVTHGDELEDTVFTTTYHRSLELARNARKRIQFTVLLDNFSRPLVVRIVNPTPSAHGSEITRRTINLRRQFTEGHLVVVLARDADLDYLNDSTGDNVRVVYPHPELLPARWQAYDGVSAMVVHGYSLENLSARQYAALLKWISQGGRLVVSGGPDYSLLRTPRLAALLPGKPIGLASFANGAALSGVFSQSLAADRPFSVNQVTTTSGRTLYAADNIPLVIQTEHGLGRVFYFTFDIAAYPFDRWPGMTRLWLDAFNFDTAKRIQSKLDVAKKSPLTQMIDGPTRGFPSHVTVLTFVVIYLGILALAYQLRENQNRGRLLRSWVAWVAPLLFAPGAYFLFGPLLYPAGATVLTISAIEPFSRGVYAHLDLAVGIYSNRRQPTPWEYQGLQPVLVPRLRVRDKILAATDWSVRDGPVSSVMALDSKPYVLHQISGQDIIKYDLHASAKQTAGGLFLTVRNNTGHQLAIAGLVFNDTVYAVPAISAEAGDQPPLALKRSLFSLEKPDWRATLRPISGLSRHTRHTAAYAIKQKVNQYLEQNPLGSDEALLIGVSSKPVVTSRFESLVAHHNVTLVLVRVPVSRARKGSRAQGVFGDDPG